MLSNKTIAAIATAAGGAIGIVRLSGAEALEIAQKVWQPLKSDAAIKPRYMHLGQCKNGEVADDQALLVYMPGPNSYTGEDVVELQCHGGLFATRTILARLMANGAIHAEPGEFTKRAFLNGKLDLTQAEAVNDIIHSHSEMALHAANRQLDGSMGRRAGNLYNTCRDILAEIEVRLDFVDEDLDFESAQRLHNRLAGIKTEIEKLIRTKAEGEILRHGVKIVLAGAPNAGKSSLMNLFLGRDRAIVTDIPGTTRDVLEEMAHVRGIPVRLFDTAGLRESQDIVEQIGVNRSKDSLRDAQIILWMIDATLPEAERQIPEEYLNLEQLIVVLNKHDDPAAGELPFTTERPVIKTSALTGLGYDQLLDAIETTVWKYPHTEEVDVAVNARHAALLEEAFSEIEMAGGAIDSEEWELVAVSMRAIISCIGRITGESATPDILDNIFSKFCIGK